MRITKKVTYDIKYRVMSFMNTEGGMDTDSYGDIVDTLEEALHLLEMARVSRNRDYDWMIIIEDTRVITEVKE